MPPRYDEDTLVQKTTAEYLQDALAWEVVYAYNDETFGPEGTLGRGSPVPYHSGKPALRKPFARRWASCSLLILRNFSHWAIVN